MPCDKINYKLTKRACYFTYIGGSSVFCLPPMLFVTFRQMYGISYTLLGTLVLVNFSSQLIIDLIFTFFTRYFNIHKTLKVMPLLTTLGLCIYAVFPMLMPKLAYWGLLLGTVLFSVAAGLCEVLLSPLMAAIPSDTPDRDMSFLHSLYAYGVVFVVLVSTIFFKLFGTENWMYLTLFWAALPIISFVLFSVAPLPYMEMSHNKTDGGTKKRSGGLAICTACIFFGAAAENSMTNWISGYIETALHIDKAWGDLLGLTSFAVLLGLGRTLYAKYGKNIFSVLLCSMAGASLCYLVAGLSPIPVLSMLACVLTGLCASLLWPGTLILMEERIPNVGVTAYALMAAGGDFGSSVAPQLLGVVVDTVSSSGWATGVAKALDLSGEQLGMKVGMVTAAVFPILGVILLLIFKKYLFTIKDNKT